jgi:hypothetical protein
MSMTGGIEYEKKREKKNAKDTKTKKGSRMQG